MSATEHVTLSAFLQPLITAVNRAAVSTWVAAEISEYSNNKHAYITLIEHDADGAEVARLKVSIWANSKAKLLARFKEGTGGEELRKGLKILVKLRPTLHLQYGLSAVVEDIDGSYTLGDAARKLIELRKRLIEEGAYDRQRALPTPTDFTAVAVIAPAGAAGEGDFRSHADPLESAGLCRFAYFTATFQGERASPEIVSAFRAVFMAHKETPFDAVILLRGGGAQSDLAWLNDFAIANAISKMPLPVLVAIGHERDTTLLDEVANVSFHTPSKAIGYVTSSIFDGARNALDAFETICTLTTKTHALRMQSIDRAREAIHIGSVHQVRVAIDTVISHQQAIAAAARHAVELSSSGLEQAMYVLGSSARLHVTRTSRDLEDGVNELVSETDRGVTAVQHQMGRCREIIHGAATRGVALAESDIQGRRLLVRDRAILGQQILATATENVARYIHDRARSDTAAVSNDVDGRHNLLRDRSILGVIALRDRVKADAGYLRSTATKDIALIEADIEGRRALLQDRTHLAHKSATDNATTLGRLIYRKVGNDIAVVATDIDGRRGLIRDRSFLAVRNIADRVKASAEFVLGLGPEKTLQRGFVVTRHEDGKPVTRKVQLGTGEKIQLQFADGNVGATTD